MEFSHAINDRFKELRLALDLSQEQFGLPLMLTKSSVSNMESGIRSVSDRTIKLCAVEYRVSERWLRFGEGEMFENHDDEFSGIAKQLNLSAAQLRLVRLVYEMPPEYQDMVLDLARKLVADEETESDYDRTIRIASAALDEYDRQQEALPDNKEQA